MHGKEIVPYDLLIVKLDAYSVDIKACFNLLTGALHQAPLSGTLPIIETIGFPHL